MKDLFASAMGAGILLVVGCSGSSFSEGSGGAAGTSSTAGATSGGMPSAGSASGGSSNAGTNSGGAATGGSSSGGITSGGTGIGGTATGGTANGGSGGVSNACEMDTDCTDCAYPTAPKNEAECYCATCANKPMSKASCSANQKAFEVVCSGVPRPCPAIACVLPPTPVCKSHMCVAK